MLTFDEVAPSYDRDVDDAIAFSGQDSEFFTQVKSDLLLKLIARHVGNPAEQALLDVGCGVGKLSRQLVRSVSRLHGVDVSSTSVDIAQHEVPEGQFTAYDGERLPYEDNAFDISVAACVMHHVPPTQWSDFLAEMQRVTRCGGLICICEHNPYNPLTRLAVARCHFDRDAVLLTRGRTLRLMRQLKLGLLPSPYMLFFPFSGKPYRRIEQALTWLPLGAQYIALATPN